MHQEKPARAARRIESHDSVVLDTSGAWQVVDALAVRDDLENVDVYAYGYPYGDGDALARVATTPGVSLTVSMVPSSLRDLVADGTVSYLPRPLYDAIQDPFLGDANRRRVLVVQVPDTGSESTLEIGCTSTFADGAVEAADVVIAERNPNLPAVRPARRVRASTVQTTVPVDQSPPVLASGSIGEPERKIAASITELLPEYPTIQIGLGTVGKAVGEALSDRPPLDVWSGLFGEGLRRLVDAGVTRSATGAVAIGESPDFYEWFREQESIRLAPPSTVYDHGRLHSLPDFVAINSALQVDLTGAVNAESIGGRVLAGIGGQTEFMRMASTKRDGLSIIAMPSRTPGGKSKVVPSIPGPDPVTTPGNAVDVVVTEHGVADLRSLSRTDRRSALVGIAHPDDRDDLRRASTDRDRS